MEEGNFVKFLGTAGARFVVAKQLRSSAGTFIRIHGKNLIVDPGPGTLVRLARSRPAIDVTKLDAVMLTHTHIDHSNDANILIDAMTNGGLNKRGVLFTTDECLNGENAVILKYLRSFLEDIVVLRECSEYHLGDLKFSTSVRHQHSSETYGIKFDVNGKIVSFLSDTKFFPELIQDYAESDILVINAALFKPHDNPRILHLCIDDVKKLILEIKPGKVILTHFGMTMLKAKPWEVADELRKELGIEVLAASDGMRLDL